MRPGCRITWRRHLKGGLTFAAAGLGGMCAHTGPCAVDEVGLAGNAASPPDVRCHRHLLLIRRCHDVHHTIRLHRSRHLKIPPKTTAR